MMLLEKYLITHCAPTLASLKTASLFCLPLTADMPLEVHIGQWNHWLQDKGITLLILKRLEHKAWIYVCRLSHLRADLQKPGVGQFLASYGYAHTAVPYALDRLKERLAHGEEFPHEIGIFLGYPLGDVIGFIHNAGKNSKCSGCWKVYCNECETVKLFDRIHKCRAIYARQWKQGKSVRQLTVAA